MILKPSAIYTFFKSTLMLPGWGGWAFALWGFERARKAAGVNTHLWMYRTNPSAARTWDERALRRQGVLGTLKQT